MEGALNCLFTAVALPIGLWCLGYGVYLLIKGQADYGVFLILLGLLMVAAVGTGALRSRRRARKPSVSSSLTGKGGKQRGRRTS